jgi:hypothetical protein
MKEEGILTDLDLSILEQMVANLRSMARNIDHPYEILSILLVKITAMLYSGLKGSDGYRKADILQLITEFDAGNIGTFEDLLFEIARETTNLKKLQRSETFSGVQRTIDIETIEKETNDTKDD